MPTRLLVYLVCLLFVPMGAARTLIVLSQDAHSYWETARAIESELSQASEALTLEQLGEADNQPLITPELRYVVAVGARATDYLLGIPALATPLISTFIPQRSYQQLVQQHHAHRLVQERKLSAIYLDQPYARQFLLARLIAPDARTVGTALGEDSQQDLELLQQAAGTRQFQLKHATLREDQNPIKQLQPLIQGSDLFLTLPDKAAFTRTTAKWILYISLRQRIPLIGFSSKYVESGAVAAVFSSPSQIGQQTGELLNSSAGTPLPAPQYPRYFSVVTNKTAARSLRLALPDDKVLEQSLREAEQ